MYQPKVDEQQSTKAQLEAENNSITGAPLVQNCLQAFLDA